MEEQTKVWYPDLLPLVSCHYGLVFKLSTSLIQKLLWLANQFEHLLNNQRLTLFSHFEGSKLIKKFIINFFKTKQAATTSTWDQTRFIMSQGMVHGGSSSIGIHCSCLGSSLFIICSISTTRESERTFASDNNKFMLRLKVWSPPISSSIHIQLKSNTVRQKTSYLSQDYYSKAENNPTKKKKEERPW